MNADLYTRMLLAEFGDGGKQRVDGAFIDAKRQLATSQAFEFGEAFFHFVAEVEEAFGVVLEEDTGISEADRAGATDEEGLTKVLLELADAEADGGLGAVEAFRGAGEGAFAGDGEEDLEFA